MDDLVLTPAECVALINQTLEIAYPTVMVEGEVDSFKFSRDKYIFFDLKDEAATLSCFMMAWQLKVPLEDGMRIKVLAEPRLTRWGKFSLTIRQIMPVGQGSIKRAFELLKTKLQAEGLLDASRKRLLPPFPRRIGLIGSVESAGYADFMKIINARWGNVEILVANVGVQGLSAIRQNIAAVQYFNQQNEVVDVLVIIRGGGSVDDLAVYNDEQLARAIAGSRIPTLVGVGHEVDISLADLVADVRAATPSNAAQLVVPDRVQLHAQLQQLRRLQEQLLESYIERSQQQVQKGKTAMQKVLDFSTQRLQLQHVIQRITTLHMHYLTQQLQNTRNLQRTLRQLDPQTILKRGYALIRKDDMLVIDDVALQKGDHITIEMSQVLVHAVIEQLVSKEEKL